MIYENNLHFQALYCCDQNAPEDIQVECKVCTDKFLNESELQKHIESQHSEIRGESTINWDNISRQSSSLQNHNGGQHESNKFIDCNQRDLRSEDTKTFATHIGNEHSNNPVPSL